MFLANPSSLTSTDLRDSHTKLLHHIFALAQVSLTTWGKSADRLERQLWLKWAVIVAFQQAAKLESSETYRHLLDSIGDGSEEQAIANVVRILDTITD